MEHIYGINDVKRSICKREGGGAAVDRWYIVNGVAELDIYSIDVIETFEFQKLGCIPAVPGAKIESVPDIPHRRQGSKEISQRPVLIVSHFRIPGLQVFELPQEGMKL